jgi:hypothetical protein
MLGSAAQSQPIDAVLLQEPDLYLQLTIDGVPLLPRQQVGAAPYAIAAHTAENLSGGTVDASSVSVNGAEVIGSSATWTGSADSIPWSALADVPADADTLGGLSCADGLIAAWDATLSQWVCASDLVLTASEVLAMIAGATLDLGSGSQIGGLDIATTDDLTWGSLAGIPSTLADGVDDDTVLSSLEVLAIIDGQLVVLGAGSQVAGVDIATVDDLTWGSLDGIPPTLADGMDDNTDTLASLNCVQGERVEWDGAAWVCVPPIANSALYVRTAASPTSNPVGVVVLCDDENDVALSGGCIHDGGQNDLTGGGPTTNAFASTWASGYPHILTVGSPGPSEIGGWGCAFDDGGPSSGTAYVLCLDVP